MKIKIGLFDIESSPILGWTYSLYDTTIIKTEKDWKMLSWSFKWLDGKMTTRALCDYPNYAKDPENDKALVTDLAALLEEADIVMGHNGDNFDIKKTNQRMVIHGLKPYSPNKTVDTLKIARQFKFTSNRLDYVCEVLGIGTKIKTEKDLWYKCFILQDPKAWDKMKRYNKHDVVLLEELYKRFLPWIPNHPTVALDACPNDGDKTIIATRDYMTKRGPKFRGQCKCGHWYEIKAQQNVPAQS